MSSHAVLYNFYNWIIVLLTHVNSSKYLNISCLYVDDSHKYTYLRFLLRHSKDPYKTYRYSVCIIYCICVLCPDLHCYSLTINTYIVSIIIYILSIYTIITI